MDKRKQIGILYIPNKNWIAGSYYVLNLIHALHTLDDSDKPLLNVYTETNYDYFDLKEKTNYLYIKNTIIKLKFNKFLNKIFSLTGIRIHQLNKIVIDKEDTLVFPISINNHCLFSPHNKLLIWIPDFQEKYYPEFFNKKDLRSREMLIREIINLNIPVVVSSQDSKNDFDKFYPRKKNKLFVLNFTVNHPQYEQLNSKEVLRRYSINKDYFFCANQFWKHKNHKFLFEAYKTFLEAGNDVDLVCSGTSRDVRNPEYHDELLKYIKDNKLECRIHVLGFIDRREQLCLMKNSVSIIQPSLFEGWNTTVEDAKAINKHIILSDLNVHKEQISKNVSFFKINDINSLIKCMLQYKTFKDEYFDYGKNIKSFANDFINIVNEYTKLK